jgi:hypothetical protein
MAELPVMASLSYQSNTSNLADVFKNQTWLQQAQFKQAAQQFASLKPVPISSPSIKVANMSSRRLVQVFIADPDENVPLESCLLYSGKQKLTDLTDQELFFEIDIKSIMDTHNQKRASIVNKSIKERTENLEPARIRDLKMTVVTIATF